VVKLRALAPASQVHCIVNNALCDLPHLVRCALEAGVSADTRCYEDDTPVLSFAAQSGSEHALKALLDGRANHALVDKKGWTAAHDSAYEGHTGCLRLLIDAGAQLTAVNDAGYLHLHLAAQEGHAECCSLLLSRGSDANARTTGLGETPLMAATGHKLMACVRVLLPESDLSVTNEQGNTVFHVMIALGNLEGFELLLPLISDVDVRTVPGVDANGSPSPVYNETPLHLACFFGQERMVKALLHRGALRAARDSMQRTPLHEASLAGHLGCVRQLLGKPGAYKLTPDDVNAADVFGWTSLHSAAQGGHARISGMLCAGGARLDAVESDGYTPLMVAQELHPTNTALIDLLAGRGPAHLPGTVCDQCGRPEPEVQLSYCTGCLMSRFCGNACLVAAWPAHRAECQRIQAAREARSRPNIIQV